MTYEKYEIRVAAINGWFDEYIKNTFHSVHQFGHLVNKHLNKSNAFLMNRCKKERKEVSSFIGSESKILEMLVSIILSNREELIEYLADYDDDGDWIVSDILWPEIQGRKFQYSIHHHWEDGALLCESVTIALRKDPQNKNHLIITSAYPI